MRPKGSVRRFPVGVGTFWRRPDLNPHRTFRVQSVALDYITLQPYIVFELLGFKDPKYNRHNMDGSTIFTASLQDFLFQFELVSRNAVPEGTVL